MFAAVFIGISEMLSPFVNPIDAWLYRSGAWVIFFSMYLALSLKVDASDEESQSQGVFAKLLIAAHAGMVFMIVVQAVLSVKRGLVSMRDEPVANKSFRKSSFAQQLCDGEAVSGASESQQPAEEEEDGTGGRAQARSRTT